MKRTREQAMKRTVLGILLALPLAVQAQSWSKTETITYHDNPTLWVLGQTAKVTCVAPAACRPRDRLVTSALYDVEAPTTRTGPRSDGNAILLRRWKPQPARRTRARTRTGRRNRIMGEVWTSPSWAAIA